MRKETGESDEESEDDQPMMSEGNRRLDSGQVPHLGGDQPVMTKSKTTVDLYSYLAKPGQHGWKNLRKME